MEYNHTIRAALYENKLTEETDDYVARVKADRTLSLKALCESAAQRGGATVSAAAMEIAVREALQEMQYRLADGFSVNLEYLIASVHIKGVFNDPSEQFNPDRHEVKVEVQPSVKLADYIRSNVDVVIDGEAQVGPSITRVVDTASGTTDNLITSDRNLFIYGSKIKIAGTAAGAGVAFVDINDGTVFEVPSGNIIINEPSKVLLLVPHYAAGVPLRLRITTQYSDGSGRLLNAPRSVEFSKILTTASPA